METVNEGHPDFPGAKTLLVSTRRPCSFLERSTRELLAGGVDVVILSALGDAIPLCVQLQNSLEEKEAATRIKTETVGRNYGSTDVITAGLRIYMKKHPNFKGSRISPGYVSFAVQPPAGDFTPLFEEAPTERTASLNAGDGNLYVGGGGVNKQFADLLRAAGQDPDKYENLHRQLLAQAETQNETKGEDAEVRAVQLENLPEVHPDLKVALCRPCREMKKYPSVPSATGAVFFSAFQDGKFPHADDKNIGMVYVVGPKGSDFKGKAEFLEAVQATATNVMTILCDYNGVARREGPARKLQRMNTCRIPLFSGGAYKQADVTKHDVAKSILSGLETGYRHGPAPRLHFAYDEDTFRKAWTELTGLVVQ